jgi:hypothetical protein
LVPPKIATDREVFLFLIFNEGVLVGFPVVAFDDLPSEPLELSLLESESESLLESEFERIPPLAVAALTELSELFSEPVELSSPSSDGSLLGVGDFLFRSLAPPALPPAINV